MFLYARLVMENLVDQPTQYALFEELDRGFPEGLEEA
jgi:hypothetical protein